MHRLTARGRNPWFASALLAIVAEDEGVPIIVDTAEQADDGLG